VKLVIHRIVFFIEFYKMILYNKIGDFMTFSTKLKEEICNKEITRIEAISELMAILRFDSTIEEKITTTFENASVARRVFKDIKKIFNVTPHIIIRNQNRLRKKQIYILEIKENLESILNVLNIKKEDKYEPMKREYLETPEEMVAFVRGTFLVIGSINDPKSGGYHLEYVFSKRKDAEFMSTLLHEMKFESKVLERNNKYMVYLKSAEEISDMIRMFESPQSLFYFEDIRIYRDHKNMVNRLNNCEIANQEKSTTTGLKQIEDIKYIKENDLTGLLEEKTQLVMEYRLKYPESSYQELALIIKTETDYQIGKSGINHHFIKIRKLVEQHKNTKS